jgi:hypothetical protein
MPAEDGLLWPEEVAAKAGWTAKTLRAQVAASKKLQEAGTLGPHHLPMPADRRLRPHDRTPANPTGKGAKWQNLWRPGDIEAWLPNRRRPGNPDGFAASHAAARARRGS